MALIQLLIWLLIEYLFLYWLIGRKLTAIGYPGSLWVVASLFGGLVAFPLATSLPDLRIEGRRKDEENLLDEQLRQASLPIADGAVAVPRITISDDLTQAAAL
jgi:hypothetical protein